LIGVAFLAASLFTAQNLGSAQDNTNNVSKTDEQKLDEAQTRAQTRYYEAQAAKLEQERSLSQRIINLSAFLAALVAVLSLVLNYSSTLRTQRDSQFLEALKRFGDKDSPAVRASAAGLLAKLSEQKGIVFRSRRPNFDIVLDQLMAGLLLEENSVCVTSIIDAVRHLTASRPSLVLPRISGVNLRLQKDMVQALAKFLGTRTTDEKRALNPGNHWSEAATSTPYTEKVLNSLALRHEDDFRRGCRSAIQEYKLVGPQAQMEMVSETQRELSLIANRLSLSVQLCAELINLLSRKGARMQLAGVFLVNASLPFTDLKNISLESAQLQGTTLTRAILRGARLQYANLQWADLNGADLQEAVLTATKLEGASLEEANLQKASLFSAQFQPLKLVKLDGTVEVKKTSLECANLEGANLANANLRGLQAAGANFKAARLNSTSFYGMSVKNKVYPDKPANFENSEWWTANFFEGEELRKGENDDSLLEFLFNGYGSEVPKDATQLSWSVRQFQNEKMQPEEGPV
jgi:uncharacterized protein YjbI with pentapeptide repeats